MLRPERSSTSFVDKLLLTAMFFTVVFVTYRLGQTTSPYLVDSDAKDRALSQLSGDRIEQKTKEWTNNVSWRPRVFVYNNVLTDEECDHIIKTMSQGLAESQVSTQTGRGKFLTEYNSDPVITKLAAKIAGWTHMGTENCEDFWMTRYRVGQEFKEHVDYFNKDGSHDRFLQRGGQRVATAFIYLNTPPGGGELHFPTTGLKIPARKGTAVLVWNVLPNGKEDPQSLHASLPVTSGTKWVLARWIRAGKFQ